MLGRASSSERKRKENNFLHVTFENVFQIHLQAIINMNDIGKHSHLHVLPPLRLSHEKLECSAPKGKTRTLIDYDLWCYFSQRRGCTWAGNRLHTTTFFPSRSHIPIRKFTWCLVRNTMVSTDLRRTAESKSSDVLLIQSPPCQQLLPPGRFYKSYSTQY